MNKFVRGGAPTVTRAQIWRKEANRIGRNGLFDLSLDAITGGLQKDRVFPRQTSGRRSEVERISCGGYLHG